MILGTKMEINTSQNYSLYFTRALPIIQITSSDLVEVTDSVLSVLRSVFYPIIPDFLQFLAATAQSLSS